MLKSGRKRAQRIHEHNERVRRIEAEIAFMEMISKNRTDIVLNLKKGYLCTNSNVDSKQMYVLKNDLVASGDIRLPNSTILEIEKVDEDRNLITVKNLGRYSPRDFFENFKIIKKIEKRTIKFEE
jgi:hypothetical protein